MHKDNKEGTSKSCGCCDSTELLTPMTTVNRPGLSALSYRIGTHTTFFKTMKARLSSLYLEVRGEEVDEGGKQKSTRIRPLSRLTTRERIDLSIAFLDAWATIGDVLTFYQERIANEGYLRTATERSSVLELVRLIGYKLRPGVASSVYLALELDKDYQVKIKPYELKAQSLPGPGEMPQTFENIEQLDAHYEWNKLRPRQTRPQTINTIIKGSDLTPSQPRIYVKGTNTNLKLNDVVLITEKDQPYDRDSVYRVFDVKPDPAKDCTLVLLRSMSSGSKFTASTRTDIVKGAAKNKIVGERLNKLTEVTESEINKMRVDLLDKAIIDLTKPASVSPRNAISFDRDIKKIFDSKSDIGLNVSGTLSARLKDSLPAMLKHVRASPQSKVRAYVFRVVARPFGHNAPLRSTIVEASATDKKTKTKTTSVEYGEWTADHIKLYEQIEGDSECKTLFLDANYDKIQLGSWVVVDTSGAMQAKCDRISPSRDRLLVTSVKNLNTGISRAAYGISGPSTAIQLANPWFSVEDDDEESVLVDDCFNLIRQTTVYVQSEELPLAEEPIEDDLCTGASSWIDLDGLYSGLESGRWMIVTGERTDITVPDPDKHSNTMPVAGIKASELVMLSEVIQDIATENGQPSSQRKIITKQPKELPEEKTHTFIKFAKDLAYCYKRDTVTIYGNVVKATHGETRGEMLGSGDASQTFQSFTLKQPPLTFVASPIPAGAESTLKVYVNDVQWHEADSLMELSSNDCKFMTKTDHEGKTTVIFGYGVRPPTGVGNIRSAYRSGIGKPGNVRTEQISQLMSKPLGVKGVINPMRASGGTDREGRDTARKNAPRTVTALDRLVSVSDYADFARTFAGIGKAVSARITDGRREYVYVTIAGADDIPIDETSDLYRNLLQALCKLGDPYQPVALQVRELLLLIISANVRILPDYQWEKVAEAIRAKLLETFSFENRELGQDVLLSEVIRVIQAVQGVAYVDIDVFGEIPEKKAKEVEELIGRKKTKVKRSLLLTPREIAGLVQDLVKTSQEKRRPESRIMVNLAYCKEGIIRPAQLAFLTPDVSDTLIINQVK